MSEITDVLEALVAHPGWRLLAELARKEWAIREYAGRKHALNDTDDKRALDKLRQITAAQEAVEWVLALPKEEIQRLKRQELPADPYDSRKTQELNLLLTGMSRRGTL